MTEAESPEIPSGVAVYDRPPAKFLTPPLLVSLVTGLVAIGGFLLHHYHYF